MTAAFTSDDVIFNVAQAAKYLGVGPKSIRRLCQQRKLAFLKADRRGTVRIHRDALDALVKRTPVAEEGRRA